MGFFFYEILVVFCFVLLFCFLLFVFFVFFCCIDNHRKPSSVTLKTKKKVL